MTTLRRVDLGDAEDFACFHAVYAACYDRPFDQPWGAPEKRVNLTDDAYGRHVLVVAQDGDDLVGGGYVSLPLQDNVDSAWVEVFVLPDHRRRSHGSRVLDTLVDVARQEGRTLLRGEAEWDVGDSGSAGSAFASAHGFVVDILDAIRELALPVPEVPEPVLQPGDRLVAWRTCPAEWVDQYAHLRHVLLAEAPSGEHGPENELWDAERVRHEERSWTEQGRIAQTAAVTTADDRLVGHTQLVFAADGVEAYQWDTLVLPEHRGRGLGLALKRHAMREAADLLEGRRRISTWNAASNTHMIAVNDALGYRQTAWAAEYVRHLRAEPRTRH